MTLPPASSSCRPRLSSWFLTREGSAPGMSHFVNATMMGQSAALACAIASSVCTSPQHVLSSYVSDARSGMSVNDCNIVQANASRAASASCKRRRPQYQLALRTGQLQNQVLKCLPASKLPFCSNPAKGLALRTSTASRCQSNHHSQKCDTSLINYHLGHDAVVCSHHQDDDIGDRRPSRAHGSEGCMPGSVQECCGGLQPQPCIALSTHTVNHVHQLAEQSGFQHFSCCRRLKRCTTGLLEQSEIIGA